MDLSYKMAKLPKDEYYGGFWGNLLRIKEVIFDEKELRYSAYFHFSSHFSS